MDEKEKQDVINRYAREAWKADPEKILVLKESDAQGVSTQLRLLTNEGYDETKVVVVFPEEYSLDDLEANKPEPEGTIWYLVYHKKLSKILSKSSSKGA
jgi:hypothetical protein